MSIFVIGANLHGECGVNHSNNISQLTNFNAANKETLNSIIKHIYNGCGYTIYHDDDNNIWSVGDNKYHSCCFAQTAQNITTIKQIEYFTQHNIHIKRICVNVSGYCSFFIADNNAVYGNGDNKQNQLGMNANMNGWWKKGWKFIYEPKKIKVVNNVFDIVSAANYSLALRMSHKDIILHFCNRNRVNKGIQIHEDVLHLIMQYMGKLSQDDYPLYQTYNDVWKHRYWKPIEAFKGKDIIKIATGKYHSLALESNGNLYSWGNNRYEQLGNNIWKFTSYAQIIPYFKENEIKIKDMKCGWTHNLVLDDEYNVYSFGKNDLGQCGHNFNEISKPILIDSLKGYDIKSIECGSDHSYVETFDGKHFLFGKNNHNQCMTNDKRQSVIEPHCINKAFEKKSKHKMIRKVFLGVDNTHIIVSNTSTKQ